jgi:putative phosphoesterase
MKIALIGDVHANLPALESVLAHIRQQNVTAVWNTGDFVGYNAFPNEVINQLRQVDAVSIVGNYDLKVLKFKKKKAKWKQAKCPLKYQAFKWTYKTLTKENGNYLHSLPKERRFRIIDWRIMLIHGSPAAINEALTPHTSDQRFRELAQMSGSDVVICGHSHRPFARQIGGVWFINPGSVGRPDDGDPRATYAILQLESDKLRVKHYRLGYDIDRAVKAIRQNNLPEAFGEMLRQGRNLNEVLAENNGEANNVQQPTTA